jgi:integrase
MAIFQKEGSWYIDFYVGRTRMREKIGPSKNLANEVLRKRLAEVAEGRFFPERRKAAPEFVEFAEKYWKLDGSRLKARGLRGVLDRFKDTFGGKRLTEISVLDVQVYYNETEKRTTAATANRHANFLSALFSRAKEWGDLSGDNPVKNVRRGREENRRLRFLSEKEIESLLSSCSSRLRPVLVCALLTGMRLGEILNLHWENISIEHATIYILQSKSGELRELPIARTLQDVLIALGPKTTGPVFEIPEITMRVHFKKALMTAEISNFRFHDLRHTFASHFIMKTGDLPALQKLLGHSTPEMTQRYAHLAKSHLVSEIALLDSAMKIKKNALQSVPNRTPEEFASEAEIRKNAVIRSIKPR